MHKKLSGIWSLAMLSEVLWTKQLPFVTLLKENIMTEFDSYYKNNKTIMYLYEQRGLIYSAYDMMSFLSIIIIFKKKTFSLYEEIEHID